MFSNTPCYCGNRGSDSLRDKKCSQESGAVLEPTHSNSCSSNLDQSSPYRLVPPCLVIVIWRLPCGKCCFPFSFRGLFISTLFLTGKALPLCSEDLGLLFTSSAVFSLCVFPRYCLLDAVCVNLATHFSERSIFRKGFILKDYVFLRKSTEA